MKVVSIGKGLYRVTIRSKEKRDRLAKIPDVTVDGVRVIFPEGILKHVKSIIESRARSRSTDPEQTSLF